MSDKNMKENKYINKNIVDDNKGKHNNTKKYYHDQATSNNLVENIDKKFNILDKKECGNIIDENLIDKNITVKNDEDAIAYITTEQFVNKTGFFVKKSCKRYVVTTTSFIVNFIGDQVVILNDISAILLNLNGKKNVNRVEKFHVLGYDGSTDIVVLEINDKYLTKHQNYLKFEEDKEIEKGNFIYTINFSNNIIGALNSGIVNENKLINSSIFNLEGIATNLTPVNDSLFPFSPIGGPILNEQGKVVGMISRSEANGDIVIGVPTKMLQHIVESIIKTKTNYVKGFIGIEFATLNSFGYVQLTKGKIIGLYVNFVVPGSPAAFAGLLAEDVIIKVNKTLIGELYSIISSVTFFKKPGDVIKITYLRNNIENTVEIVLADFPIEFSFPLSFFV